MNLLAVKIYYDGSHYIAIPHTERPYRQKRQRQKSEKSEEVQQFEQRFEKVKGGRKNRKAKLLSEFTPMFKDEGEAEQFVEEHFNRLSRNRWERYKRMIRRGYTNRWNYFCTYTYDSEKHTEETFRKTLMNTLYHLSSRRGWRYMGAWERGEVGQRLHFHALTYIPENGAEKWDSGCTFTHSPIFRKTVCLESLKSMKITAPSATNEKRVFRTAISTSGSAGAIFPQSQTDSRLRTA